MGENFTTPGMAREQGRNSALAGRDIFVNPHVGGDAEAWFEGYRAVPEAERGTRPDLLPQARLVRKRTGRGQAIGVGVHRRPLVTPAPKGARSVHYAR